MKWKFFDLLLEGKACPEEIHDHIECWHNKANVMLPLHDFLGMSWREFKRWVQQDATIETLAEERKEGKPVDMMTNEELILALPMTTREDIKEELGARLGPGGPEEVS